MSYLINGTSFSTYNMSILSSGGALDFPKRIGEVEYDWGDSNGIEAFVLASELIWDGREIVLRAYYNGSNMITDIETMLSLKGTNYVLTTTYTTHTVRLLKVKVARMLKVNQKAFLDISFWETTPATSTPPAATGGSGTTLGGYDFRVDFGLHLKSMSGFGDVPEYIQRNLSYGNSVKQISAYRKNRSVSLELNGRYASLAALNTAVNNLRYLLISAGTKSLVYRGITKTVYFTDGARVDSDPKKLIVRMTLKLKIQE